MTAIAFVGVWALDISVLCIGVIPANFLINSERHKVSRCKGTVGDYTRQGLLYRSI